MGVNLREYFYENRREFFAVGAMYTALMFMATWVVIGEAPPMPNICLFPFWFGLFCVSALIKNGTSESVLDGCGPQSKGPR